MLAGLGAPWAGRQDPMTGPNEGKPLCARSPRSTRKEWLTIRAGTGLLALGAAAALGVGRHRPAASARTAATAASTAKAAA